MTDLGAPSGWQPPGDAGPGVAAGPDVAAPTTPIRRRNPVNVVLAVVGIALLLGAETLAALSAAALSNASTDRGEASSLDAQRRTQAAHEGQASTKSDDLQRLHDRVKGDVDDFETALDATATAQTHLVDIGNRANDLDESGNRAGAQNLLESQGEDALTELNTKAAATDKALTTLQADMRSYEDAVHG